MKSHDPRRHLSGRSVDEIAFQFARLEMEATCMYFPTDLNLFPEITSLEHQVGSIGVQTLDLATLQDKGRDQS